MPIFPTLAGLRDFARLVFRAFHAVQNKPARAGGKFPAQFSIAGPDLSGWTKHISGCTAKLPVLKLR